MVRVDTPQTIVKVRRAGRVLLAAGALQRNVLAWRSQHPAAPLVVVVPGGVRAEGIRADRSTIAIPLTDGGGILESRAPGSGLTTPPG